jgi:hypothetical protein
MSPKAIATELVSEKLMVWLKRPRGRRRRPSYDVSSRLALSLLLEKRLRALQYYLIFVAFTHEESP